MFNRGCKVCLEKDRRIEDLKKTLDFVQKLYSAPTVPSTFMIESPERTLESEEVVIPFDVGSTTSKEVENEQSEAARVLMGNY